MRIRGAKQIHYDSGPTMTPLVDVVMVILIFLMLASSGFVGAEHFLVSNLPLSQTGAGNAQLPPGFIPDEPIDIRVDAPTPDAFMASAGRIRTGDTKALAAQLKAMRLALNQAGKDDDHIQVKIGPGKNVKYKFLVEVYEAALNAGYKKVAFATSH
jgi:biopolymer transport protein ExbD